MSHTMRFDPEHRGRLARVRRLFRSTAAPAVASPEPTLPAGECQRYRFCEFGGQWRVADERGIRSSITEACAPEIASLDFDSAITLSYRYLDEAEAAEARGDALAKEQWATWAEELQIYAARRANGGAALLVRRSAAHHDEQAVSFAEMTRR